MNITNNGGAEYRKQALPPRSFAMYLVRRRTSAASNRQLREETIITQNSAPKKERNGASILALLCLGVILFFHTSFINLDAISVHELSWENKDSGAIDKEVERDGFMVLGMHRSGTSMLTGLLYMAGGYTFGGFLYKGKENSKGFFERFDVVNQNDAFLEDQEISWEENVLSFDWEKALRDKESGEIPFKGGNRFFRFTKDAKNIPWLQKDPRMCITLKTWIKIMDKEPAIVFTYRHPLEVAMSLEKRKLQLRKGLKLWIAYNMRAIQNSRGLCIVKTSNTKLLANPNEELQRISAELTTKCNVVAPPHKIKQEEVEKFIDPTLQHHNADDKGQKEVLETHNGGTCVVYGFQSKHKNGSPKFREERQLYLKAMRLFCDLETGKAFREDYEWPEIIE